MVATIVCMCELMTPAKQFD